MFTRLTISSSINASDQSVFGAAFHFSILDWIVIFGYLFNVKTVVMCFNSTSILSASQLWSALSTRVSITDSLWQVGWLGFHCIYLSVWVGFRYTWNPKKKSSFSVIRVARNGNRLLCMTSTVVLMWRTRGHVKIFQ